MQTLQRPDQLHVRCGSGNELLLAQPHGGRVLHPSPPILLPQLLAVGATSQRPSEPHPGSLHRGTHPGDPAHDGLGGVEEQAQRGDRLGDTLETKVFIFSNQRISSSELRRNYLLFKGRGGAD